MSGLPPERVDPIASSLRVIDRALEGATAALAAIILIALVGLYVFGRYAAVRTELHAVVAVTQEATESFAVERWDSWEFAGDRLAAKIEKFIPARYTFRVTGSTGVVLERGGLNNFMLTDGAPIRLFGVEAGRIEIGVSPTELLGWGLLTTLFGAILFAGFVRGVLLKRPRTAMRQAENELKARNNALELARDQAQAANHAKDRFLASMSHELRTPLNAVIGFSELLQMDSTLNNNQRESAHEINLAGKHLLTLVNDVLDLSKIELGVLPQDIAPVDAVAVLRESEMLVHGLIKQHGFQLTRGSLGAVPRMVLADGTRLRQVLVNLLSNACKYNRPDGRIRTFIEDGAPGFVRIGVEDSGIGISEEKHARVFVAFDRLGAECVLADGSGIGLAIVKRLAESMNGRVGFRSVEGEGSTFWIELPVAQ